jgi:hypothetical protein
MSTDGEGELSRRCVESISSMGNSSAVVDADGYSDDVIANVAEQLQEKGWQVEVLLADGDERVQLVISPPASARTAVPPKPAARVPAPEPGGWQRAFEDQMDEDGRNEGIDLEQGNTSSKVTFTASKKAIVLAVVALGVFAAVWVFYISPRRQLDQLAQDTCDDLEGSIMLVAASTLSSSINKAERLGFTGRDLGDRMREHCPSIMRQIMEVASEY